MLSVLSVCAQCVCCLALFSGTARQREEEEGIYFENSVKLEKFLLNKKHEEFILMVGGNNSTRLKLVPIFDRAIPAAGRKFTARKKRNHFVCRNGQDIPCANS